MKKTYINPRVEIAEVEMTGQILQASKVSVKSGVFADDSDALSNGRDEAFTDIWGNTYN